jgi:hypothetical protein
MISVHMSISQGVNKVSRLHNIRIKPETFFMQAFIHYLQVTQVSYHVCEQRIAGDVKRNTKTLKQQTVLAFHIDKPSEVYKMTCKQGVVSPIRPSMSSEKVLTT